MSAHPSAATVREPFPREIWVLVGAAFVIALGYGLIAPVLPRYADSFGVGYTLTAIVFSAFAFCRLVFAPFGGSLVRRLGERPVYLIGVLVVAASTGACALAANYTQLLVFRALGGVGSTMFTVSAVGLIVRLSPPALRGRVSAAYAATWLIGGILGPVVGGHLARFGFRVPFVVYAVALLLAAAVVAVLLPAGVGAAAAADALPAMTLREALRDSAYVAGLLSGFANGWANFGVRIALVPLFLTGILGTDDAMTGNALAAFAIGNGLVLTMSGRWSDRVGRRLPIIVGLVANGALTAAVAGCGSVWLFLVISLGAGAGIGLFSPSQQAVVADVVGRDRSAGSVLPPFQMAGDFGAILGPVVAGVLVDRAGFGIAFLVTGILVIAAGVPWLWARESNPVATGARSPRWARPRRPDPGEDQA